MRPVGERTPGERSGGAERVGALWLLWLLVTLIVAAGCVVNPIPTPQEDHAVTSGGGGVGAAAGSMDSDDLASLPGDVSADVDADAAPVDGAAAED